MKLSAELFPPYSLPILIYAYAMPRAKKGQLKVQILKKTTVLYPSLLLSLLLCDLDGGSVLVLTWAL